MPRVFGWPPPQGRPALQWWAPPTLATGLCTATWRPNSLCSPGTRGSRCGTAVSCCEQLCPVQAQLAAERDRLLDRADRVESDTWRQEERRVPAWVRLIVRTARHWF